MGSVDTESLASLFLLPDTIVVEALFPSKTHLTVQVACMLKNAACPLCERPSERIHSKYGHTVADMPCGGRRVTLALTVRKFVCDTPECPRKIFTERLPEFKKMAKGIRQDYAAVKAAFSSMWSQGQVEAQVNCLKLQKRMVFGRANFDLLRLRVLCRV